MDILILGGSGFLSSALAAACRETGHRVTVVTRGRRSLPPDLSAIVADRSDAEGLRSTLGDGRWDLVIDSILFQPGDARAAVDIFAGRAGRYVFISTDFVYGGEPRRYPLTEDAPREALGGYGRDKAACEDILLDAADRLPVSVLRPPHILGASGLLGTGSLQGRDPWLLWRMRTGRPLILLDGGALLIQPVHRDDIARACLAVAASEKAVGRAYNMAGPDAVTTRRYYELIAEILGVPLTEVLSLPSEVYLAAFPDRGSFTLNRAYSLERLADDAGFRPTIGLRAALAEVVAALDAQGSPAGEPPAPDPLEEALRQGARAAAAAMGS